MDIIENPAVAEVFNHFPESLYEKIRFLRILILETAAETAEINSVEETLKWSEPAYLTKTGSTIRIGSFTSSKNTTQYAMYFNCKTKLIDTFKEIYSDSFNFEGNRAIVFNINDEIPVEKLKHCIKLSLTYHRIKHLPLLGA